MTVLADARLPLLLPRAEAREKDDEHSQEQQHHGCETSPHADRVIGMRAFVLLVDVVFDSPEEGEINRHDRHRQRPCDERNQGAEDRSNDPSTHAQGASEERNCARDRVEYHHIGQSIHTVRCSFAKNSAINRVHDVRRLVANALRVAIILIGLRRRYIKHAMPECAESDAGMANVARI